MQVLVFPTSGPFKVRHTQKLCYILYIVYTDMKIRLLLCTVKQTLSCTEDFSKNRRTADTSTCQFVIPQSLTAVSVSVTDDEAKLPDRKLLDSARIGTSHYFVQLQTFTFVCRGHHSGPPQKQK